MTTFKIQPYFAPVISETTFAGTHATVNEPKID